MLALSTLDHNKYTHMYRADQSNKTEDSRQYGNPRATARLSENKV